MQLVVDQRDELVERAVAALTPDVKQVCDVTAGRRLGFRHLASPAWIVPPDSQGPFLFVKAEDQDNVCSCRFSWRLRLIQKRS